MFQKNISVSIPPHVESTYPFQETLFIFQYYVYLVFQLISNFTSFWFEISFLILILSLWSIINSLYNFFKPKTVYALKRQYFNLKMPAVLHFHSHLSYKVSKILSNFYKSIYKINLSLPKSMT